MDTIVFFSVIAILGAVLAFGGKQLANAIKGLDLKTVEGALVAFVVIGRYGLYLFISIPLMLVVHYLEWREPPNPTERWFEHQFSIQFEHNEFPITNLTQGDIGLTTITHITGNVHFGQLPNLAYLILFIGIGLWLFFAYQFLRHAETVLRSLYDRTPFAKGNDVLAKKLALLSLGMALTIYVGKILLAWCLSQSFEIEGVSLEPLGIDLLRPFVIAGVLFVMSEVFRVGQELKEENELTV